MFWLLATGLIVIVGAPLVVALIRRDPSAPKAAEQDMTIYKDQIAEVERDLSRGVLNTEEAEAARVEVARRLLSADKRAQTETEATPAPKQANTVALAIVACAFLGGAWLYSQLGVPGLRDLPLTERLAAEQQARENRPSQSTAEAAATKLDVEANAQLESLVAQLRDAVSQNPTDQTGLRLLVDNEARLGNMSAARAAQQQLMDVLGDNARPSDFTDMGEIMILAAGGYVSPEAESALAQALNRNPRDQRARYYSGLALAQTGRPDVAYRMWAGLLEEGPADAPWIPLIQSQLPQVARAAGIPLTSQPQSGPSQEDIENANQMSDADRQNMIRGMVSGLADRLATDGGTPAEWARLIRAYGVLGERGNANAIWTEAKETFKDNADAMTVLTEAARAAEIIN
ncbi:c-type cytochrome biogenesis protein CcmI [Amylibacter sp. IMCC11727]|uniref:c-type cytochrome biogenesis protein CcmI n=1 Tax=Amylibacter sp. IMCC11727 TaxID=3039851 RepID=UPI00244DAE8A|nr:c-type cytochrome biogenesis protein CcmI [Amylibacter sp. IMCC11727]WGI21039.1 c-type cytochrome biogenesis protein CcmI [Amylibacter sp. IMCC11727]